jgi:cytidylate kinase
MSIVAISETLGSRGTEIGRELARALVWEFADREIIAKAAERYGEGVMELQHVTEEKPTLWERFTDSKRHYLSYVEATIFEMAARGSAVLVGHGAAVILRELRQVLRVRITAPEPLRAEYVRRQQGFASDEAALGFVRDSDHERASRMRFLYHVNLDDPLLYDLALNTERVGVEEGVRLIREALQGTIVQPTEASGALARDLSLAAQAKARLLVDPTTRSLRLSVTAAGGDLTVAGMVDSDVSRDAALAILRGIPGAAGVKNEIIVVPISRSYVGT